MACIDFIFLDLKDIYIYCKRGKLILFLAIRSMLMITYLSVRTIAEKHDIRPSFSSHIECKPFDLLLEALNNGEECAPAAYHFSCSHPWRAATGQIVASRIIDLLPTCFRLFCFCATVCQYIS